MKVLIVGLGLIGGSYAKGLTKKGYEVYVDSDVVLYHYDNMLYSFNCTILTISQKNAFVIIQIFA